MTHNKEKKIAIERIEDSDVTNVIDKMLADGGGNIGIVVNTVRCAQELARELANRYGEENVELLHSSFLATERARKEAELMKLLGRGAGVKRSEKKIVVGTQVIEQSLDIDFDLMISELAPIDLLIQRLGRLHRHDRVRPSGCRNPKLYLLGCSDTLDFQEGSVAVYGGYLLTRTQYFLGEDISLPKDISPLVQAVYGDREIQLTVQENEKYAAYQQEAEEKQRRMKAQARTYRLLTPYLGENQMDKLTLHDWLDHSTEDKSDEGGNSQVRDADESIEVIALRKLERGYCSLFGNLSERDLSDCVQNAEIGMQLAGDTLRLPRPLCASYRIEKTIWELEDIYRKNLRDWDASSWLKGSLGILFDEEMNCSLNGYLLHYDPKYGLSYQREE